MSDDAKYGLTIIIFIGSVFSPYYAWARNRGRAEPENHLAVNVALYGSGGHRWTMTERGRGTLDRSADHIEIGPSSAEWLEDGNLLIEVDEITAPVPRRVRGRVLVSPLCSTAEAVALDEAGRHHWHPIAPRARVTVSMDQPAQSWTGSGYIDHNRGREPLEAAFSSWTWCRTIEQDRTRIYYDIVEKTGKISGLHLSYTDKSERIPIVAPPMTSGGQTLWRLPIDLRSEDGARSLIRQRWEDGPFYARTLIAPRIDGSEVLAVHETVSLSRFATSWVQYLLPFRMPRRQNFRPGSVHGR